MKKHIYLLATASALALGGGTAANAAVYDITTPNFSGTFIATSSSTLALFSAPFVSYTGVQQQDKLWDNFSFATGDLVQFSFNHVGTQDFHTIAITDPAFATGGSVDYTISVNPPTPHLGPDQCLGRRRANGRHGACGHDAHAQRGQRWTPRLHPDQPHPGNPRRNHDGELRGRHDFGERGGHVDAGPWRKHRLDCLEQLCRDTCINSRPGSRRWPRRPGRAAWPGPPRPGSRLPRALIASVSSQLQKRSAQPLSGAGRFSGPPGADRAAAGLGSNAKDCAPKPQRRNIFLAPNDAR